MKKNTASATFPQEKGSALKVLDSGLNPYEGPWEFEQAAHLLRRCTFAPNRNNINQVVEQGLETTLNQLFANNPLTDLPVYYNTNNDPYAPLGETWIEAPLPEIALLSHRRKSLRAWTIGRLVNEGICIREKLTLFWHNHFAVGNISDPRFLFRHVNLVRTLALGNFRDLVKSVTIDPAMLRFLNGNQNTNSAPNENFARELLELYTIGKGTLAGPGDYTFYTEQDVVEMAKILTGWKDTGHNSSNPEVEVDSIFLPEKHDTSVKTLSNRFNQVQIPDLGASEYSH